MSQDEVQSNNLLDKSDVGELLENYRPWCRVFIRQSLFGQLGRRIDESDVIQSTWLDVIRKLDQFNGKSEAEFFAWLKKILENNLKNAFRDNMAVKRDFRREQDFGMQMGSASLNWWEPIAPDSTPSNKFLNGESALRLAKAIESLPENQRTAVELRHLQGMKLREVCDAMDKTSDAVVSLLRRGLKTLSATLTESRSSQPK